MHGSLRPLLLAVIPLALALACQATLTYMLSFYVRQAAVDDLAQQQLTVGTPANHHEFVFGR